MHKFHHGITGQVDEFDIVMSGEKFKNGNDTEPVFNVVIPKGFKTNDILFVCLAQRHWGPPIRAGERTFSISTGISTTGSRASDCPFVAWRETSRSLTCSRLNPEIFTNHFYKPAVEILGPNLSGFIFEQEYQPKKERVEVEEMAESLDTFFKAIPYDKRYHIELRTEAYLSEPEFDILEKMGQAGLFRLDLASTSLKSLRPENLNTLPLNRILELPLSGIHITEDGDELENNKTREGTS